VDFEHADDLRATNESSETGSRAKQEFSSVVLDAPVAVRDELTTKFPCAALSAWEIQASRAFDLILELEEVRCSGIADHAHVSLRPGVPIRLVACLEPATPGNRRALNLTIFRVGQRELLELLRTRIDSDAEDLDIEAGWVRSKWIPGSSAGARVPLAVWSWNPPESALPLQYALVRGRTGIFAPDSEWFHRQLGDWPHPIWVLDYCALPMGG
jgi:hypothetical protein